MSDFNVQMKIWIYPAKKKKEKEKENLNLKKEIVKMVMDRVINHKEEIRQKYNTVLYILKR